MNSLRFILRQILSAPGFTVIVVLTLALGLGANTAIFSAVHSVLLKPLPFPEGDRLVSVRCIVKRDAWERRAFSLPDFRDYRAQTGSFAAFASYTNDGGFNLTGDGEAARIAGQVVSYDYFAALAVQPALGRTFTPDEDAAPGLPPLVVLGHDLWRTRYGASPAIIGQPIRLNEINHTVVGVMPAGFHGVGDDAQLWVPSSTVNTRRWNGRGNRSHEVVARLRPGVTLEQARADLTSIGARLAAAYAPSNSNYSADLVTLREELFGSLRLPLLVLLGAVVLVLAATCANVTNLLLVRLAGRRREIAIRVSVGATRGALARMFLVESAVLATAGGLLGLLFAAWGVTGLAHWAPMDLPRFVTIDLHWPAVAFALAASAFCALAIGALPALLVGRTDLNAALKDAGRSGRASAGGARTRAVLVATEIALSLALLVAAVLLVRSFVNLMTQSPGYSTENVLTLRAVLPEQRYTPEVQQQFVRTLLERAAALPGLQSVAIGSDSPLEDNSIAMFATIEGGSAVPAENETRIYTHFVSAGFFRTTGITLLQGEPFADSYPEGSEPVAIVSESFARRFWPTGNAIGQRLKPGRTGATAPWFRIIGVVAETKYRGLVANPTRDPDVYGALAQSPGNAGFTIIARTANKDGSVAAGLRQLVTALDPHVPVSEVTTIEARIQRASASQRFSAQLMAGFAVATLLLAAIGLYGVVSFSVGERTQEIGIRMALGARPADIARMVLGGTGRIVALGIGAGLAVTFALTRLIESLLFNVDVRDPLTYVAVATVLAVVAMLAAWLPARRATKVDPLIALRTE